MGNKITISLGKLFYTNNSRKNTVIHCSGHIFINDDTDSDNIPNYRDRDDDGDGILTKDEYDVDGDGVADDSDGDGIPDYLDNDE